MDMSAAASLDPGFAYSAPAIKGNRLIGLKHVVRRKIAAVVGFQAVERATITIVDIRKNGSESASCILDVRGEGGRGETSVSMDHEVRRCRL